MSSVIAEQKILAAAGDNCHGPIVPDGPLPRPSHEENATLASRIKYAREYRGLEMNQLGRLAGAGSGFVSLLEAGKRGKNMGFATASKFASALKVDANWLMTGELAWFHDEELRMLRQKVAAYERGNQAARRTPPPIPSARVESEQQRPSTIPPKSSPKRRAASHGKKTR